MLRKLILHTKWRSIDVLPFLFPVNVQKRSGEVQVLCFHGICPSDLKFINARFYYADRFEELITELKKTVNFISLQQWLDGELENSRLNVLLTFDDGYRNNRLLLLPLIEKLNVPVVIFVTAQTEPLWMDIFDILVAEEDIPVALHAYKPHWSHLGAQNLKKEISRLGKTDVMNITEILRTYFNEKTHSTSPVFYELLSDEDLHQLQKHRLVGLGNHSGSHISFTALTETEMEEEIRTVQNRLTKIGTSDVYGKVFAYPFGHYDRRTSHVLQKNGMMQLIAYGDGKVRSDFIDRLVIHPFLSTRNMVRAVHNGKY